MKKKLPYVDAEKKRYTEGYTRLVSPQHDRKVRLIGILSVRYLSWDSMSIILRCFVFLSAMTLFLGGFRFLVGQQIYCRRRSERLRFGTELRNVEESGAPEGTIERQHLGKGKSKTVVRNVKITTKW